jgi:hypothetical protein
VHDYEQEKMAKRKTHRDDSSLLRDVLRDDDYEYLVVDQVPAGATLLHLKSYIAGNYNDNFGLTHDVVTALGVSLSETLSWEKILHSK